VLTLNVAAGRRPSNNLDLGRRWRCSVA